MNIYDFDGTIYNGDSCRDIIKYGLKKHPFITYRALKKAKKLNKEYENGLVSFEKVKETMLSFIFEIPNYPFYSHKYYVNGELIESAYFESETVQYIFKDNKFAGVCFNDTIFNEKAKKIMTRTNY